MPVLEFALDSSAQYCIQIHLPTGLPASLTIMLNNSILGTLTSDEQNTGKDFHLPDNSFINVRMLNGQPQVLHNGYLLPLIDDSAIRSVDWSPAAQAQKRDRRLGGCLITWLILNLIVTGGATVIYFFAALGVISLENSSAFFFFLFAGFLSIIGLVGASLIFFWKKLGFYLLVAETVLSLLLLFLFHLLNPVPFFNVIPIAILYIYLNRSGIWEKMS